MKVSSQTRVLQEAVQLVSGVVPNNATRPILTCVFLKATPDGLLVQGTDLEVGLSVRVDEVLVEDPGSIVIPASRLHAILRETQAESVSLESTPDGSTVTISADGSVFKVPSDPADEFPELEFKPPTPAVRLHRETLLSCLRMASIAAARDATRFQMHSVLFDCTDDVLRLVSTDGKRMAIAQTSFEPGSNEQLKQLQYIVPLKGVDLLMRILAIEELEAVDLHLDESNIIYTSDRISLSCRLVEGKFPDYVRAVPPKGDTIFEIPCDDFAVSLRQASLMTTKETNTVLFSFQDDRLVLATKAVNVGESRVELGVERVSGSEEELTINFNPTYLLDLIKVVGQSAIRAQLRDAKTAGLFESDQDRLSYKHIVMPLVTNSDS